MLINPEDPAMNNRWIFLRSMAESRPNLRRFPESLCDFTEIVPATDIRSTQTRKSETGALNLSQESAMIPGQE
jgi:hypothetical protein